MSNAAYYIDKINTEDLIMLKFGVHEENEYWDETQFWKGVADILMRVGLDCDHPAAKSVFQYVEDQGLELIENYKCEEWAYQSISDTLKQQSNM